MSSMILSIIPKLALRHSIPLPTRTHIAEIRETLFGMALLGVRTHARSRLLPSQALARVVGVVDFALAVVVGVGAASGFGALGVEVLEAIDTAFGLLAANVDV